MKDDNFVIHVTINGFRMPLKIARKNEEVYRDAEKKVNKLLLDYWKKYNQRSAEEVLSMTAYQLAVALSRKEFEQNTAPVVEKIEQLDKELEKILSENK